MSSINKAIILGTLGRDPEMRRMQNGKPVCTLSVATSEKWKDKQSGERKENTVWHKVVIFNEGLCTVAERYLKKGSKVYIEGAIQTRQWEDQSGNKRYSTEIVLQGFNSTLVMLDSAKSESGVTAQNTVQEEPEYDDLDSDIPF